MCFGSVYRWTPERRLAFLLKAGLGLAAAFVVLRAINVYGDPAPWSTQASSAMTIVSFLNVTKYPPSLLFLLMALGPALLILRALDGGTPRILAPAIVFGRVPLFYFLLHLPLIHLLAVIVCLLAERCCVLDVSVAKPRCVPVYAAAWLGAVPSHDLSAVGARGGDALSGVPVVCVRQTAPDRPVADLFVTVL